MNKRLNYYNIKNLNIKKYKKKFVLKRIIF